MGDSKVTRGELADVMRVAVDKVTILAMGIDVLIAVLKKHFPTIEDDFKAECERRGKRATP
jgi:hypothetical protein